MADATGKKGGGSKLNRTQTVTLRLDPKLRYLTDLGARSQRRTTSGFIEWAIEIALKEVGVYSDSSSDAVSLSDIKDYLWDVEEADRFLKLAIAFPSLLNHHEQLVWKIVEIITPAVHHYDDIDIAVKLEMRKYWDEINAAAESDVGDREKFLKRMVPFLR